MRGRAWARAWGTRLRSRREQRTVFRTRAALGAGRGGLAPKPRAGLALFLLAAARVLRSKDKRERSSSRNYRAHFPCVWLSSPALQIQWPLRGPVLEARGSEVTSGLCFTGAVGSDCRRKSPGEGVPWGCGASWLLDMELLVVI